MHRINKIQFKIFLILILLLIPFSAIPIYSVSVESPSISALSAPIIADHTIVNKVRLDTINNSAVQLAKDTLHVAYFHTSHGSQLTANRLDMIEFMENTLGKGQLYNWTEGGEGDSLYLDDYCISGDLGNPDYVTWETLTRPYLDANPDVNVFMGSWCGQVSGATEENINTYLSLMTGLENDYPNVTFVYMTGHVDGSGLEGNLHIRNEQIRAFCNSSNKVLFDFADIESYDPDCNYFGDKYVQDSCTYDGGNWATEWCASHTEDVDWFSCSSAHSHALNANMKTYAMWWIFAQIAHGGVVEPKPEPDPDPNPDPNPDLDPMEIPGFDVYALLAISLVVTALLVIKKKNQD